jgi:uroporphyrinogen-III synthase
MSLPLESVTVAVAEGRQLEELAEMLAKEGAAVHRCPMISILDAPDPDPVLAWIDELIAGQFSHVVLMTGEGVRRLLGFAERAGRREAFIEAMANTRTLTRGPKPARALKEIGLTPALIASAPTTDGVIATLGGESLSGSTVGVQLFAPGDTPITSFLAERGARSRTVLPYIYAPATDAARVTELIDLLAAGQVHVLVITSSPQVDRLFEVAAEHKLEDRLRAGLSRACVAAVGPIVADAMERRGIKVQVCPPQGFVMKNLVQHILRWKQ